MVPTGPRRILSEAGRLKATLETAKLQISSVEKQVPHVGVLNFSSRDMHRLSRKLGCWAGSDAWSESKH